MILVDKQIKEYGETLISPYDESKVQSVGYDLTADQFCEGPGSVCDKVSLMPMESVFVRCKEAILLPDCLAAQINLRNSRIRMGLTLDAPLYIPGHETKVFFRVTNISRSEIDLFTGDVIASVSFLKLDEIPDKPYSGTFQNEFEFKGMAGYTDVLSSQMKEIEKKTDKIENMEHKLYSNVLSIMAIFVAIFSIINVNVVMVGNELNLVSMLIMNLSIIGSVGFLMTLVDYFMNGNKLKKIPLGICVVAFIVAALLLIA